MKWLAAVTGLLPFLALGATPTNGPALVGATTTVNNGPGDQTDPHVSGDLAAYTSVVNGTSNIHYFQFLSSTDNTINNGGALDFLSDVSGSKVVFTRASPGTQAIYLLDTAAGGSPSELDALPGSARREGRIGGNTVVWEDFGLGAAPGSDALVAWDLTTNTLSVIINDGRLNKDAEVSASGTEVAWVNCALDGTSCVVYDAANAGGAWTAQQLTTNGAEAHPDTNGTIVAYASTRTINGATSSHVYWQPVGGGTEQVLNLAGNQYNPTLSGTLIAYEGQDLTAATPNTDIYVYDTASNTNYQITSTSQNETLNDISTDPNGLVRVIWQVQSGTSTGWDVYAFSFQLVSSSCPGDGDLDGNGEGDGDGHGHIGPHHGDGDGHGHRTGGGECQTASDVIARAGLLLNPVGSTAPQTIAGQTVLPQRADSLGHVTPPPTGGCSAAGGGTVLAAIFAVLAWLSLARVREPVRVSRRR